MPVLAPRRTFIICSRNEPTGQPDLSLRRLYSGRHSAKLWDDFDYTFRAGVRGKRQHLQILETFLDAIASSRDRVNMESWEFENGRLAATLTVKSPIDVPDLVKSLEATQRFKNVNSETNAVRNSIKLTMTVVTAGKS